MQNIFIDFLPPWVETGLQPAFYDKESGTVLQQTARMYAKVNEVVQSVNNQNETIADYIDKFNELHDYVHDYFDNLDVQTEINNKIDEMVEDGTLMRILEEYDYVLNIKNFNCVDDGVTDNTTNLISAFNYCYTNNRTLYVPKGIFAFSTPITIANVPNIKMDGELKYTGSDNNPALVLGNTSAEQNNLDLEFMVKQYG